MQQQTDKHPSPGPNITLHFLDDSGVLFDAESHRLYSLNTTATYIWCCLEEGHERAHIESSVRQTFGFEPDIAASHVAAILREWNELGLLRQAARNAPDHERAMTGGDDG